MSAEGQETIELYDAFKQREQEAEGMALFPEGSFPCVRLDGFRHSRSFLKDTLRNDVYAEAVQGSVMGVFVPIRKIFDRDLSCNVVGMCTFSDEVSFILTPSLTNDRYGRRTMKICTMLAGMLSSQLSARIRRFAPAMIQHDGLEGDSTNWNAQIISYDARPLALTSPEDVARYLRHRYLVAKRHSYWKVLNVKGHPDARNDEWRDRLDILEQLVREQGWEHEVQIPLSSFAMYLCNKNGWCSKWEGVSDSDMQMHSLTKIVAEALANTGYTP